MASTALDLTADLPTRRLDQGEVLYGEGDVTETGVVVLVEGSLRVELGGSLLSDIDVPGSFVGEIGGLLGTPRSARVVALETSTVRTIGDPDAFFLTHPTVALELSRQLAGRLQRMLVYLSDVRAQYGDSEGHLSVIDSVLGKLASRAPVEIEPGSDRAPDY
jgi:CRP-like cAMP-binding protein